MKKLIGLLLAVVLVVCVFAVPASAALEPSVYGDTDGDKEVTATDALNVLKLVVGKESYPMYNACLWDVDADWDVTATDALEILKKVVGKVAIFKAEENSHPFNISGWGAATVKAGQSMNLDFSAVYESGEDYSIAFAYDSQYTSILQLDWGDWNHETKKIPLIVKAGQVDRFITIPVYIYIQEQPSAYIICNINIQP
ncbi:MAG: hypothetical protein IKU10_02290 [Clostridia bacterium]|nr:hypothetical protein [Clostridia bacterium]